MALRDWLLQLCNAPLPAQGRFIQHMAAEAGALAEGFGPWGGVAILPLPNEAQSYLIILRHCLVRTVRWAGAPSKETLALEDGTRVLGPRRSFDIWRQLVQDQSEHWSLFDQDICADIAKSIREARTQHQNAWLRRELSLLGSCMARLNDMVIVTEAEPIHEPGPRIVYVNDAFVSRSGYAREEVLGRSPRFLQGPRTDRATLDKIRKALSEWRPISAELINYTKHGEPIWVEISIAPVADQSGWYTHWVAVQRDIEDRKRAELDIQKLVYFDSLTGLPNRRLLLERLRVALLNSERYKNNGALIFIDLDRFKDLNDTLGHHVGDELLRQVAMRLAAELRPEDTVARLGGDEFVVLLENLPEFGQDAATNARMVVERLMGAITGSFSLSERSYTCSASFGIALFQDSEERKSAEDLLRQADFAMYQSKHGGRNTWRFYDATTQDLLVARSATEADLRQAFGSPQLCLHYQPVFNKQRQVCGVEALLRWQHPQRGLVSPSEFIPIAEECGLIVPLGTWVLEQTCQVLAAWGRDPARQHWTMAVNISARQMHEQDFAERVAAIIKRSGCNPQNLLLELTETLLHKDYASTHEHMNRLRTLGVRFALDDFGTGYSSLSYLRHFPISNLKIDRSFVMHLDAGDGERTICKTIVALGEALGMDVVAEGVEQEFHWDFLQQSGCGYFQGFLLAQPMPLEQLDLLYHPN